MHFDSLGRMHSQTLHDERRKPYAVTNFPAGRFADVREPRHLRMLCYRTVVAPVREDAV